MQRIEFQEIPKQEALDYFQSTLNEVDISFSQGLKYRLGGGEFCAIVPSIQEAKRLIQFSSGLLLSPNPEIHDQGYLVSRTPDTIEPTSAFLACEAKKLSSPKFYVSEINLGDEQIRELGLTPYKIDQVQYILMKDEMDAAQIADILGTSTLSWHFMGFLLDSETLSVKSDELWEQAMLIIVGAHDGESYLIWKKPDRFKRWRSLRGCPAFNE